MTRPASKRVLLVGAGGHARVCLEALRDSGHHVVGAVSRGRQGVEHLGVEILGTDDETEAIVDRFGIEAIFLSVGDNAARAAISRRCQAAGIAMVAATSRFAMVSSSAVVCDGAALMAGAVVNAASIIGTGAIINTNASVDHDCDIGDYAHIAPGVALAGGVKVGEGAMVGVGACVLPNVSIGARAVVGGGAVIVADVPADSTMVGVPGRTMPDRLT